MNGTLENKEDVTFIDATIPSHKIIMAAEASRRSGGALVDVGKFVQIKKQNDKLPSGGALSRSLASKSYV